MEAVLPRLKLLSIGAVLGAALVLGVGQWCEWTSYRRAAALEDDLMMLAWRIAEHGPTGGPAGRMEATPAYLQAARAELSALLQARRISGARLTDEDLCREATSDRGQGSILQGETHAFWFACLVSRLDRAPAEEDHLNRILKVTQREALAADPNRKRVP